MILCLLFFLCPLFPDLIFKLFFPSDHLFELPFVSSIDRSLSTYSVFSSVSQDRSYWVQVRSFLDMPSENVYCAKAAEKNAASSLLPAATEKEGKVLLMCVNDHVRQKTSLLRRWVQGTRSRSDDLDQRVLIMKRDEPVKRNNVVRKGEDRMRRERRTDGAQRMSYSPGAHAKPYPVGIAVEQFNEERKKRPRIWEFRDLGCLQGKGVDTMGTASQLLATLINRAHI